MRAAATQDVVVDEVCTERAEVFSKERLELVAVQVSRDEERHELLGEQKLLSLRRFEACSPGR